MKSKEPNPETVTGQIYLTIFELLENNPDGLQWSELNRKIEELNPSFHPKTINGCVWKLLDKYQDRVYKPKKGLFKLKKFK